jgi:hypothetical protein
MIFEDLGGMWRCGDHPYGGNKVLGGPGQTGSLSGLGLILALGEAGITRNPSCYPCGTRFPL